jgi:hypothetical protein
MGRIIVTEAQRETAHLMRLAGKTWAAVEAVIGFSRDTLRRNMKVKGLEMQGKFGKLPVRKLSAPPSEIRFHVMRLGNRKAVAELYGVGHVTVYQALPVTDIDYYHRGQMVSIGGILAKKCFVCGVARELERFLANPAAKSGCRETCDECLLKARMKKYNVH